MAQKKEFTEWLNKKLRELNTDESVFGSYIISILEDEETADERKEALEGILSEIIENDLDTVVSEIISEWTKCTPQATETSAPTEDIDTKLAKLLENQQLATTVQRQYTEEELRIREQILSQYSQVEYEEEYEEDDDDGAGASGGGDSLMKNTNASDVAQLAKEKREQARVDSQAKKDKDKEDRAKQKQQREDKKEKRKTVKGERRR